MTEDVVVPPRPADTPAASGDTRERRPLCSQCCHLVPSAEWTQGHRPPGREWWQSTYSRRTNHFWPGTEKI